jgi:HK97 family phage major capsid protein
MALKSFYDDAQASQADLVTLTNRIQALRDEGKRDEAKALLPELEQAKAKAAEDWDTYEKVSGAAAFQNDAARKFVPAGEPLAAPAVIKNRGDSFTRAFGSWLRTGDQTGLKNMFVGKELEIRNASNNTDMNIGTAADGGDLVPVGFYQQIIARRSESDLTTILGCRLIPGKGTTVDVPYDNEADGEFVSTAEAAAFDQDAPAVAKAQMTLVKYTKKITLSVELLEDEDANLMTFLADWVARGMAKTRNQLLLTEVAASGTQYKETASATAIAAGELEATAINDSVADYLEDGPSVAWVMRPSTFAAIKSITGNPRLYGDFANGLRQLLEYPVHFSNKAAAIASTAKTVYFGNWNFVGYREAPGFTLLRDPYSAAGTGQIVLHMYFRTVYKQLQALAVGYMAQKA